MGKTPASDCSPPRNATCKIVEGLGTQVNCCCGCTRGPGPVSCVFSPVADELVALTSVDCTAAAARDAASTLTHLTDRTVDKAGGQLRAAEAACKKGRRSARGRARAATLTLSRLAKKLQRLEAKRKIAPGCAARYGELIDGYVRDIDDIATTGGGSATTTTTTTPGGTTTTTLGTGGLGCNGLLTFTMGFPDEVDLLFSCPSGGTFSFFGVAYPGGRQITDKLDPPGFSCAIQSYEGGTNNYLWCTGTFLSGNDQNGGRVHLVPSPTAGMGAELFVGMPGSGPYGPFPITGP